MNLIEKKCCFCKINDIDPFKTLLVSKLKESFILPEEFPIICSKCYKTYIKIKELEAYLVDNDILCPKCKEPFHHFKSIFDGNGYSAYSVCAHCDIKNAIILHDDNCIELKTINQILIDNF